MSPPLFNMCVCVIALQRYVISMQFIERYETLCASQASVRRLRSHPSYNTFMAKWSLPVYFQIRFQEIAGAFEGSLVESIQPAKSMIVLCRFIHLDNCTYVA